jgi:hypothetical protein
MEPDKPKKGGRPPIPINGEQKRAGTHFLTPSSHSWVRANRVFIEKYVHQLEGKDELWNTLKP